jgi:hypothetical protein
MTDRHRTVLKIMNVVAFAGVLVVNGLSNALPLNGYTAGELSDMYPNLFVPAGITFSIWGVIYLLLAGFCVYQFLGAQVLGARPAAGAGAPTDRRGSSVATGTGTPAPGSTARTGGNRLVERVGWLFPLSCAGNIGWLFAWHYRLVGLSALVMAALLVTLLAIYHRLGIARHAESAAERLFGHIPFGVYTGWISVALIANVTALLVHLGWNGFGVPDAEWALVLILIAAALGSTVVILRRDIAYGAVFIWAFIGILVKRAQEGVDSGAVPEAAIAGIAAVGLAVVLEIMRSRMQYPSRTAAAHGRTAT